MFHKLLLLTFFFPVSTTLLAEEPFINLSFDEAKKVATETNKVIFIDFYTDWCGPCKMLDKVTWKDKSVQAWLQKNTVALKIDAEAQRALARQYNVTAFPTLMFIDSEGAFLDQITGYRGPEQFLKAGEKILAFGTAEKRLEHARQTSGDNIGKLFALAPEYGRLPDRDKGFQFMKDLWEKAERENETRGFGFYNLVRTMCRSAQSYPPARTFLEKKLAAYRTKTKKNPENFSDVQITITLLSQLRRDQVNAYVVETLDQMEKGLGSEALVRSQMLNLIRAKAYQTIADKLDLAKFVDQEWEHYTNPRFPANADMPEEQKQAFMAKEKKRNRNKLAATYELYKALDRDEDAAALAEKMLREDRGAENLSILAWAGYASGKANQTDLNRAHEAYNLSQGQNIRVIATYIHLLVAMDRKDQAEEIFATAEQRFDSADAVRILEKCRPLF